MFFLKICNDQKKSYLTVDHVVLHLTNRISWSLKGGIWEKKVIVANTSQFTVAVVVVVAVVVAVVAVVQQFWSKQLKWKSSWVPLFILKLLLSYSVESNRISNCIKVNYVLPDSSHSRLIIIVEKKLKSVYLLNF